MNFLKKIRSNMSINVIGALVGLMVIFGAVIGVVGYFSFENSFKEEYATTTFHMARVASLEVNPDHIDNYLNNEYQEEYEEIHDKLQNDSYALNVSIIYVIKVDTTDYNSFVSIFNVINNDVDNTSYTPWELGYKRNTTNDDYRHIYQSLYEKRSEYETIFRIKTTDGQHPHITTLIPVKNTSGDVVGILCIQRPVEEMMKAFAPYFSYIILGVSIMGVAIIAISILFIRKAVIRPVQIVSKEATRFAKENTNNKPLGNISRYEDILNLARSIDSMESEMIEYIESITKITAEKEKTAAELNIASQIQQSSLPSAVNAFPDRKDFKIFASMDPAKEVGGDFYNFFLIDDDHLALVIADVSGKGVPAALFMMVSNILISEKTRVLKDPATIIEYVNNDLYEHNQSTMFVTVWLGILELSTGKLTSCNAGHEDPFIYRKGGVFTLEKEKHSFIVGAMSGMKYQNQTTTLNKGDKLFVYTDGLPEANNANKEQYRIHRVAKALNDNKDKDPEGIIAGVKKDVDEFVADNPQFDDLTMLCIEIV